MKTLWVSAKDRLNGHAQEGGAACPWLSCTAVETRCVLVWLFVDKGNMCIGGAFVLGISMPFLPPD